MQDGNVTNAPLYQERGIGEWALLAAQPNALPVKANPAKRLYERPGFENVNGDGIQFHMRLAPSAPAESRAE